jgi:hypothetical protein
MLPYQKKRLAEIKRLEGLLSNPRTTLWQKFNIREQLRLYRRMIEIDKATEKRLKPQLLKRGKK